MTMGAGADKKPERRKKRAAKGKARFEIDESEKALAVHLDRQAFRRLLDTLERLAATGERQTFEKSGRGRAGANSKATFDRVVFHIDE